MSRGPDAATLLQRALAANAERAGCMVTIAAADWSRWASATFAGARHVLTLASDASPLFDKWLDGLPEAVFDLRGHLVADLKIEAIRRDGGGVSATIEILTIEER